MIDDIKNEIQKATTDNFEERKEKTQDELHVQEIKRQISQNAGEKVELNDIDSNFVSSNDHRSKNTNGIDPKTIHTIHQLKRDMDKEVKDLQEETQKQLIGRRNFLIEKMDQMLGEHFQHLREEN